jgi:hypothetical protein
LSVTVRGSLILIAVNNYPQLFPYHLAEYVCRVMRISPFRYYCDMIFEVMRNGIFVSLLYRSFFIYLKFEPVISSFLIPFNLTQSNLMTVFQTSVRQMLSGLQE